MDWQDLGDSLKFKNHPLIHNQIQYMNSNHPIFEEDFDRFLAIQSVAAGGQLERHSFFVKALGEAWSQCVENFISGLYDLIRKFFFHNLNRHDSHPFREFRVIRDFRVKHLARCAAQ